MRHAVIRTAMSICIFLLPLQSNAATLPPSICELIQERLEKYEELMDELVFLDENFVASDPAFKQLYTLKVTYAVLGGELTKISEAKEEVERLCR